MPKKISPMVIKPEQRKTTMVLMDDGAQLSVEELLHKLNGAGSRRWCQCDGSYHEQMKSCP